MLQPSTTHFIVQTRPKAVVDISASSLVYHESSKPCFQSFHTVVHDDTCAFFIGPIRAASLIIASRTAWTRSTRAIFLSLSVLLLVFLDLGIQCLHYTLQPA